MERGNNNIVVGINYYLLHRFRYRLHGANVRRLLDWIAPQLLNKMKHKQQRSKKHIQAKFTFSRNQLTQSVYALYMSLSMLYYLQCCDLRC